MGCAQSNDSVSPQQRIQPPRQTIQSKANRYQTSRRAKDFDFVQKIQLAEYFQRKGNYEFAMDLYQDFIAKSQGQFLTNMHSEGFQRNRSKYLEITKQKPDKYEQKFGAILGTKLRFHKASDELLNKLQSNGLTGFSQLGEYGQQELKEMKFTPPERKLLSKLYSFIPHDA